MLSLTVSTSIYGQLPHDTEILLISRDSGRMNGGLRGPPTVYALKNVDQMEKVNPYRNGIPKDLPNRTKDNHWVSKVDEKEAEESLSLYCKPVELYNIIQQRCEQKVGLICSAHIVCVEICWIGEQFVFCSCCESTSLLLFSSVILTGGI